MIFSLLVLFDSFTPYIVAEMVYGAGHYTEYRVTIILVKEAAYRRANRSCHPCETPIFHE